MLTAFLRGVLIGLIVAVAGASTAVAETRRNAGVLTPSMAIHCHAVKPMYGGPGIECLASYISVRGEFGDSAISLRRSGRARIFRQGNAIGYDVDAVALRYGDVWKPRKAKGITCRIRTTGLTCRNRSNHGFHLARGDVRRF